ncbi:hypothetical protein niasHT_010295 [Heterodera trifolii]|uniref:Exocyst complex component 5 n=1 Tax=Heterodera trifolii TaxID=157864 RepID=A0ABD2M5T3_9BILA
MTQQPYFATYIQDLEQDPFDVIDFVERLAWRMSTGKDCVDAAYLKNKFEEEIGSLQLLSDQFQSKLNTLEQQQNKDKTDYLDSLQRLHDKNGDSLDQLKQLDLTMQTVAARVVHLGDQLESVHEPRARAFEALQLMRHFDEFLADQPLNSALFTDPDRLLESAEVIAKLASIAQELDKTKFAAVQLRIAHKYDEIEQLLIEEFVRSHDRKRMREIAMILSEFKGFSRCVDAFVERIQSVGPRSPNVFEDIQNLCDRAKPIIMEIFSSSQFVVSKLLLNVFHGKLQEAVVATLEENKGNPEQYLANLHELYLKTHKLLGLLQEKFRTNSLDPQFLPTLTQSVFGPYLVTYAKIEHKFIADKCTFTLRKFYESKGHQKRSILSSGLQELKSRLLTAEDFGGETFLSEIIAINILQEFKNAFARCSSLCKKTESLELNTVLFDMLLKFLYTEHVEYAIELGLACIPLSEPRIEPSPNFFKVIQQSSAITHLFAKLFDDTIHPGIRDTQIEDALLRKRDQTLRNVEERINIGVRRQLNAVIAFVRHVLSTSQRKTDFKPEEDSCEISAACSGTCSTVVKYLNRVVQNADKCGIKDCVDGGNLRVILAELGDNFYATILSHALSFAYNLAGAMLLLCDVSTYKKCISAWGITELEKKFDSLHALANLLVVVPDNLPEACNSQLLKNVDRPLMNEFIQRRHDYKSAKLFLNTY